MKKFIVIVVIIMGVAILLGSVSHSWAGDPKKANFHFDLKFDDKGDVTGVDRWDATQNKMVPAEKRAEVSGVKRVGTILMLKGDDPCVVIGGNNYCW